MRGILPAAPALGLGAAILALAALVGGSLPDSGTGAVASAQDCTLELEPNDTPESAVALDAPGCLTGALDDDEDIVDHVLWTLDAGQAGQPWSVALTSPDGQPVTLAISRVASEPAAATISTEPPLAELRADAGPGVPAASGDLLLRSGRYVLAVTPGAPWTGTPTAYRIDVGPGAPMPNSADQEPNDDPSQASPVQGAFEVSGDAAGTDDYFAWQVDDATAPGLWTLDAQAAVGAALALTLLDEDGAVVGDAHAEADGLARLPDLRLPSGLYTVRVPGVHDETAPYILRAYQEDTPYADPEPNDDAAHALPIIPKQLVAGRLARPGDVDAYRLSVDAALGSVLLDARLIVQSGPSRRLCLSRLEPGIDGGPEGQRELTCAAGQEGATLFGQLLQPGDHLLVVSGEPSRQDPYYLRVDQAGPPLAGYEIEPNDTVDLATAMTAAETMRGRLGSGDTDYFRLRVDGKPQLWEAEARGPETRLSWARTDGASLALGVDPDGAGERSVLTDLYLIPGDHWFRLDGDGEYELTFSPLGPPIPGGEREPNDGLAFANPLPMDGSVTGRIVTASDMDFFRFSLAAPEHILLTLEPPPDTTLTMWPDGDTATLASHRVARPSEPIELDLVLPAGDHAVRVSGEPTAELYRLSLSRLDPFDLAVDQEPNDDPSMARPMPASLHVEGRVDEGDPGDWYRLPALPAAGELTIEAHGIIHSVAIHDGAIELPLVAEPDGSTYRSPPLLADTSVAVGVVADGPYAIAVYPGSTGLAATPGDEATELPVDLTLTTGVSEVAAFEVPGQRLEAVLVLTNTGSDLLGLTLDAATSHPGWTVGFESTEVSLGSGETAEVPVTIVVPAQAWADRPVRATVRARAEAGQATTFTEVTARSGAALVAPFRWWAIPDELLGGLDAANSGFGAVPLVSIDPVAEAALHDGAVPLGGGMDIATTLPLTLGVDLAGDEPVPVSGTILDPTAGPGAVAGSVRGFDLLLSADGATYETVLSGELSGALAEQSFLLPEPVLARFAQLRITSRFPGSDRLRLGEWKVVATPGWQPAGTPLDIVDPTLGGHVVWFDPQPDGQPMLETMLSDPAGLPDLLGFDAQETDAVAWVLGFMNGRAAAVTELQWLDPSGSRPELRLESVELSASVEGPLGPWTPLGTWELERDDAGAVAPFAFDAPTWLRYLHMSAKIPRRVSGVLELPGALRVVEGLSSDDYRSILGEWGHASSAGPLEWQEPVGARASRCETDQVGPRAADPGLPLEPGLEVRGCVARGFRDDWYAFSVPEGRHAVRFTVSGRPTVGVRLALFDEGGLELPLAMTPGERPGTVDYEGTVTPGARYRLLVDQSPFSVVVVYDTSGSVGGHIPIMTAALRSYLDGLVPGEEAVQLLDLEALPMPDEFSDDRWLILSALDAHAGSQTGSSKAEVGLVDALDLLAGRVGERAILLMTDADSDAFSSHAALWRRLALIRPRVFTVHVAGTFVPPLHRRLMQDWAAAGAGYHEHVRSGGSIEQAFDRMAAWLRRPAEYSLVMGLSAEPPPPPEPGSLLVVSDPNAPVGAPDAEEAEPDGASPDVAVELVLDTSGSMLRKFGRKRRIDVAKDVLNRLVAERLAPGTPVALRVFRQVPRSCESELAATLGPLDRVAMAATIDALRVKRTVSTPLAAAIEAVAADLAAVTGPRVVVVVTDGEESCGGDPEAAVQALVDQGFDLTLNVVGLGLDRRARRGIARLAEIGGGAYYDARDPAGLAEALTGALGAPYVVLDASGREVGRGTVDGAAVELPPGTYRVALVGTSDSLDVVVVESGEQRTLVARG